MKYFKGLCEEAWQCRIIQELRYARTPSVNTLKAAIPVDDRQRVYPDLAFGWKDGKWEVLVECKIEVGTHVILQAIGQCLFYKGYCRQVMLMVPDGMAHKIPDELYSFLQANGIWIVTETTLESAIAEVMGVEPSVVSEFRWSSAKLVAA